MRTVFLGLGQQYDSGSDPAVGLNAAGTVLDVHKNQAGTTLYYRVGQLMDATVEWGSVTHPHDGGTQPDCALNIHNVAVEVHKNEAGDTLYTQVGTLSPSTQTVSWYGAKDSGGGYTPGVALNDSSAVVEVHRSNHVWYTDRLYIRLGQVNSTLVVWEDAEQYDTGYFPRVALNNGGTVVEVHQAGYSEVDASGLWINVGRVSGSKVEFDEGAAKFGDGVKPSVALTDDGAVIVAWMNGYKLWQRVGKVNGSGIDWTGDALEFDDGKAPSVAAAGGMVLQVHQSETILYGLFFSSSILTDRAIWMQERLGVLGVKPVAALALPASHDSSMYRPGIIESWAKTQDLSIYDQLEYGIRWFDLRVRWTGSKFVMHHGPVDGPDLADVLADIKKFAQWGHKELAILKLSHFEDIDNDTYAKLTQQVSDAVGSWMVKTKPAGKRLAQGALKDYVASGTALMVVVDENYAIDKPASGFWVYRDADWADGDHPEGYDPADGDLRVFDVYSNTLFLDTMVTDQKAKFAAYDGQCKQSPAVPSDLYLMSWTLTPPTDVWDASKAANRCLGQQVPTIPDPNGHAQVINMVYVDYVEYARVTDVVLFMNGVPFPS